MPARNANPVPRPCACTTVRRASRVLLRAFDAALGTAGINTTQMAVMRAIQRHQGEALTRVAEDLCMDRTSLYRAVAGLRKAGWVAVTEGPSARACSAAVTEKGLGVLEGAVPGWTIVQTGVVERFGREEWAALAKDLHRLMECVEQGRKEQRK